MEAWLSIYNHTPRAVLDDFAVCKHDGTDKYPDAGIITLIREGTDHLESDVRLSFTRAQLCKFTLTGLERMASVARVYSPQVCLTK